MQTEHTSTSLPTRSVESNERNISETPPFDLAAHIFNTATALNLAKAEELQRNARIAEQAEARRQFVEAQ